MVRSALHADKMLNLFQGGMYNGTRRHWGGKLHLGPSPLSLTTYPDHGWVSLRQLEKITLAGSGQSREGGRLHGSSLRQILIGGQHQANSTEEDLAGTKLYTGVTSQRATRDPRRCSSSEQQRTCPQNKAALYFLRVFSKLSHQHFACRMFTMGKTAPLHPMHMHAQNGRLIYRAALNKQARKPP